MSELPLEDVHSVRVPFAQVRGGYVRTGYELREGSAILADRFTELERCYCGDPLSPDGRCLNVGGCSRADSDASRQSLRRGTAAAARPAAWTMGGRVD